MRVYSALRVGAAAVFAVMLVGAAGCDTSPFLNAGSSGQPVCESAIQKRLTPYGLKLGEMTNKRWRRDTFAREGGGGRTSGYRFYGRPPSCSSGDVAISLWPNCGIQQLRARGGCALPDPVP